MFEKKLKDKEGTLSEMGVLIPTEVVGGSW